MIDESSVGTRTARGEWTPNRRISAAPLFSWPMRPLATARWIVGFPGYLIPFNALYFVVAALAWWFATPSRETMASLQPGWIALLLVRNGAVMIAWYGLWHVMLYVRRSQDGRTKYNAKWPAARNERFLLGSQTRENIFWCLASGLPIWTAWEVVTLWLAARGTIPWLSWSAHPVWFVVILVLTPLWRELHFHAVHRLIHWTPLYRTVHSLHHRNTNPGPWSGLSMHPVEHVLYFSAVLIHWIVPSHPLHSMYNLFHLTLAPVPGHSGFERIELGKRAFDTGGYAHYLHHKLFEVNYSDGAIFMDRWFGSFHDGSPEADEAMKHRRKARTGRVAIDS